MTFYIKDIFVYKFALMILTSISAGVNVGQNQPSTKFISSSMTGNFSAEALSVRHVESQL